MNYKPDLCLYHANCDDGFTAAWAIWKRWPECEFRAVQYGNPPPDNRAKLRKAAYIPAEATP